MTNSLRSTTIIYAKKMNMFFVVSPEDVCCRLTNIMSI